MSAERYRRPLLGAVSAAGMLAVVATLAGEPRDARAAPHDAATCASLKTEMGTLEAGGVRADMAKGPAAAKASLPPARLQQIARLIEIEGQLRFRCPLEKPFVVLKDAAPEEGEAPAVVPPKKKVVSAKKPGEPAKDGAVKQATPKDAKPAPGKSQAAAKGAAPAEGSGSAAKPATKPRPKPASDDAYRPPAPPQPVAATAPAPAAKPAAPPKKVEN
ncbi:MAG: hypothetical protein KGP27_02000 [Hyphomicrobiales bacterium]|nr:hypothetical protein [Hyphomicrobiales bacterium]